MSDIKMVISEIKSLNRPFLLGIDGLSGAGKTTFTNKLVKEIASAGHRIVVIHLDDLIEERIRRYNTGKPEWHEYYHLQWNTSEIQEKLFKAVHQKEKLLQLKFYNAHEDRCYLKEESIENCTVVLIEGIFLQRKEWRSFLDYVIYLDCPRELRNERILIRESYTGDLKERINKYERRYWKGEEYYLKEVNPIEQANIIIKNGEE